MRIKGPGTSQIKRPSVKESPSAQKTEAPKKKLQENPTQKLKEEQSLNASKAFQQQRQERAQKQELPAPRSTTSQVLSNKLQSQLSEKEDISKNTPKSVTAQDTAATSDIPLPGVASALGGSLTKAVGTTALKGGIGEKVAELKEKLGVDGPGGTEAPPEIDQEKVDNAIKDVKDALHEGPFDWDVTHGDLDKIKDTMSTLNEGEFNAVLDGLSDADLKKWGGELNGTIGGYSTEEKKEVFDMMAGKANGENLARFTGGLEQKPEDLKALGKSINDHSPKAVQEDFANKAIESLNNGKGHLGPALAELAPSMPESPEVMGWALHEAAGDPEAVERLVTSMGKTSSPEFAQNLQSLVNDPKFNELGPAEQTAVLSQTANYPDARSAQNMEKLIQKDWFGDFSLEDKQRSLKMIAFNSQYEGGDRTILDNTLNKFLAEDAPYTFNFDATGTKYGSASGTSFKLNPKYLDAGNGPVDATDDDTKHMALHTISHEVNHLENGDKVAKTYDYFMGEYRAYYVGFQAEHGRPPNRDEIVGKVRQFLTATDGAYDSIRQALDDPDEAAKIVDFVQGVLGRDDVTTDNITTLSVVDPNVEAPAPPTGDLTNS